MSNIKNIVDQIVDGLKKQGIDVETVGVFPLGNPNINKGFPDMPGAVTKTEKDTTNINQVIRDAMEKVMRKAAEAAKAQTDFQTPRTQPIPQNGGLLEEECYCSSCLNYKTFENVLGKRDGKFDYSKTFVGGKYFDIKYWSNGEEEHLVIEPQDEHEEKEEETLESKIEKLQEKLNEAVSMKNFTEAQTLLNELYKLKNQLKQS